MTGPEAAGWLAPARELGMTKKPQVRKRKIRPTPKGRPIPAWGKALVLTHIFSRLRFVLMCIFVTPWRVCGYGRLRIAYGLGCSSIWFLLAW